MSKLSFRARQLDAYKSMPVYRSEEIPEVTDVAAINRAVPQMPTGMEKDEETVGETCRKLHNFHGRHLGLMARFGFCQLSKAKLSLFLNFFVVDGPMLYTYVIQIIVIVTLG